MATEETGGGMTGYIKHHLHHMEVNGLHVDSIAVKVALALFFVVLVGVAGPWVLATMPGR